MRRRGYLAGVTALFTALAIGLCGCSLSELLSGRGQADKAMEEQASEEGKAGHPDNSTGGGSVRLAALPGEEYVYVPESVPIEGLDQVDRVYLLGERICGVRTKWRSASENEISVYRLSEEAPELIPIEIRSPGLSISQICLDSEGNYCMALTSINSNTPYTILAKYNEAGEELLWVDVSEFVTYDHGINQVIHMMTDLEDRIYLATDTAVYLFEANGSFRDVLEGSQGYPVLGLALQGDGSVYYSIMTAKGNELVQIDPGTATEGEHYQDMTGGSGLLSAEEGQFLGYGAQGITLYDPKEKTKERIFSWTDYGLWGESMLTMAVEDTDRLLAAGRDYETGRITVTRLTRTPKAQAAQRKEITVGLLWGGSSAFQRIVGEYNRENTEYCIRIREYFNLSVNSYQTTEEAMTAMNLDIVSGDCPDILCVPYEEMKNYAGKGILEDLYSYLDRDAPASQESPSREDIMEIVLDAYTFDGRLAALPMVFRVKTVAGLTEVLGERSGITLKELSELQEAYPDRPLLENISREEMLEYCLAFQQSLFYDLEEGTCSFDSEEFRSVLEFVAGFPEEEQTGLPGLSTQNGLLREVSLKAPGSVNEIWQRFGREEVTYVGYPTPDGSPGFLFDTDVMALGISASSEYKEQAWELLCRMINDESILSEALSSGFPVKKALYEQWLTESCKEPYMLDLNGNVALDASGEPMRKSNTTLIERDGTEIYLYPPTPGEVEALKTLMARARVPQESDSQIMSIISEEAAYYFHGSKTLEEVTQLIQNRAMLYLSE